MKKILSYILILIIIALTIVPITVVTAYDTTTDGVCTVRTPARGSTPPSVPATWDGYTEARCHEETLPVNANARVEFMNWYASNPVACVPPLTPSQSGGGLCVCQLPFGEMKDGKCVVPEPKCKPTEEIKDGKCVTKNTTIDKNYYFLAPLPCERGTEGCNCEGDSCKLTSFDPTNNDGENSKLGVYLNIMIRIFIGICAVLAVIMIVIGGIQYMTSELIHSKEEGKHRITGAIFGLVLALGSWTLLNTINPDLLNTDLKSLESVEVTVSMDETETIDSALSSNDSVSSAVAPLCPEGIVSTANGIPACRRIAANFDKMIEDAKQAGNNISGYGYRSVERQKQLRIDNCKGDFTTRPGDCHPPTALPGASNHNNGLAFDLRCDGQKIATTDNKCFRWLRENASKYGLRNLASEPWHWSVDGR